jgi:nucleoid-associated protein YgaU
MPTYHFPIEAGEPPQEGGLTAEAIATRLERFGLPASALRVACEEGRVVLEGEVPDEATQERIVLAVGNMQGVERVEDRMVPAKRAGLLKAFGGLAHLPTGAANLNAGEAEVYRARPEPGTAFGPAGSLFHTVQPGETLDDIARRHFGSTTEALLIREANAPMLAGTREVQPGLVLRLPSGRARRGPPAG